MSSRFARSGAERRGDIRAASGRHARVRTTSGREAYEINREHGDDGEAARCVAELGAVAVAERDFALAQARYEEAR